VLLIILGTALALRLWGTRNESAWWDEYTSLKYLDAPSLGQFLILNRTLDPATLPLYYAFEYLWWHHVSASVYGLRCLSILIGLTSILALFDLGRRLFGARAGLIAAACLALSPIHTFHAQGIRMYVLLTLLAILSVRTFVEIAEGGTKRWWMAHALANFLLLWTHPFAALLLAAEGLALLLWTWPNIRRMVCWGLLHALAALPSAWYFTNVRFWPTQQTASWLKMPAPGELLGDILADDVLSWTYQLRVCADAFHFLGTRAASALLAARPVMDTLLFAAFVLVVLLSLAALLRNNPHRPRYLLLLLWFLLPPCMLLAASLLYRPCIFPRYTVYCSLALYLLIGAIVARQRYQLLRGASLAGLLILFGYQAGLAHPGPQRTDWLGAAQTIRDQAGLGDVVLAHVSSWRDVFRYNAGDLPQIVSSAETLDLLADEAVFLAHRFAQDADTPGRKVWLLVARPYFDTGPEPRLEAPLAQRHATFTCKLFPGIEPLALYRIENGGETNPALPLDLPTETLRHHYRMANGEMALAFAERHRTADALAMLERLPDLETRFSESWFLFDILRSTLKEGTDPAREIAAVRAYIEGIGYSENANKSLAVEAYRRAIELEPKLEVAWHTLAKALVTAHRNKEAEAVLKHVVETHPGDGIIYGHLAEVVARNGDAPRALAATEKLLQGIAAMEHDDRGATMAAIDETLRLDDRYGLAYLVKSILTDLKNGNDPAFIAAAHHAFSLDATVARLWQPFFNAALESKDYDAAWNEAKRLAQLGAPPPDPVLQRLRDASGRSE
jgi:tetratricopeptide (TPR) repeat protein